MAQSPQIIPGAGVTNPQIFGASTAVDYLGYYGLNSVPLSDVTTSLQNFLLYCNLLALSLKTASLDDQAQRVFVTAYLPRGDYYITSPIIVPELVNLKCDGLILRRQTGLNVVASYTGNTSAQALGNAYMPAVLVVPKAHCEAIDLICNPDGSNVQGAGMFVGKNWEVQSFVLGSPGTGYSVNDVLTTANPSDAPYLGATATVTSVSGNGAITGISYTTGGAYALPPVLQAQQWTSMNGFNVFDANGNLLTTGGTGTGATLTPTWYPDWGAFGTTYYMGQGGLIADTIIGNVRIAHVGTTVDGTYGSMIGFKFYGLNVDIDCVEVQGGRNGIDFTNGSDIRAKTLNPVDSSNPIVLYASTSVSCPNCVIDTPSGVLFIDGCQGIDLRGRIFNRNVQNVVGAPGANPVTIQLGTNSTVLNIGVSLDFEMDLAGSGNTTAANAGNAALSLAYTKTSNFNFKISNDSTGYSGNPPVITSLVTFGTSADISNRITGSFHTNSSFNVNNLLSGTNPGCEILVWDSYVGGRCTPYGIYEIYGSGAPTNGGSGTGAGRAAAMSRYTDVTNKNIYYNTNTLASPTWTQLTIP